MKTLLIGSLALLAVQAHALELQSYKSTSSSITKISDSAVESLWASNTPACLKDGSKILGVNKAFTSKKLVYRDCSTSDDVKEKHKALGYEVAVVRLAELSQAKIKQVMGN